MRIEAWKSANGGHEQGRMERGDGDGKDKRELGGQERMRRATTDSLSPILSELHTASGRVQLESLVSRPLKPSPRSGFANGSIYMRKLCSHSPGSLKMYLLLPSYFKKRKTKLSFGEVLNTERRTLTGEVTEETI